MVVRRWSDLSADPNSREARDFRRRTLNAAWREPVKDRVAYLCKVAAGKRVLDVGVVDHALGQRPTEKWLHGEIAKAAGSCLGVDVLPDAIEQLKSRGFNVLHRDITAQPLDEKFEVIVCGEVIEHLGSPAGLFAAAAKMLLPDGRLILTSPNPYYLRTVRNSFRGVFAESVDHVTLLSPSGVAEFAEREGLVFDVYRGVFGRKWAKLPGQVRYKFTRQRFGGPATDKFCRSLIFECVKPGEVDEGDSE